ncbi:MAG: glycosyltransferase [Coleofasciculus sp. E1-EBD-02]
MKYLVQLKRWIKSTGFQFSHLSKEKYTCPICGYQGSFANFVLAESEIIKHSRCPSCDSFERHRLQKLVIDQLKKDINFGKMRMLHFAPEYFFQEYFKPLVGEYITADLSMNKVDYKVDLTSLPFKNAEFDIVFASHVLEHIKDDRKALSEIRRVLKPKGIAILPVPIVGVQTIERLSEQKGQLMLIEAAGRLFAEGFMFKLVLVGDGSFREQIETAIANSRLEETVEITGWATEAQVQQQILADRAMVLPSFAEGLPVVIMESLALGRPVISTYVAGIPELVEPNLSGWLIPAGSVEALVTAMRIVLQTPVSQLEQMGEMGRQRVAQQHNIQQNAEKLAHLFTINSLSYS